VQHRQPLVPRAHVVGAFVLEVAEEPQYPLEGQVFDVEPCDLAALVTSCEAQEKPHRVPVAAYRRRPEAFHRHEVVGEEGVDERAEWPPGAHLSPADHAASAYDSNRPLATASSSGVIVK
jgi:hypothetical protein